MKVNIFIDPVDNRVTGYNLIVTDLNTDSPCNKIIDMDDTQIADLHNKVGTYYEDGQFVVKPDAVNAELLAIREKEAEVEAYHDLISREQQDYFEGLVAGTDAAVLAENVKTNRQNYSNAKNELENMRAAYEAKRQKATNDVFEQEQEKIDYPYYVSAMLLIKDENEYIQEWLDSAFQTGFEHIYIYDNMSEVPVSEYLAASPYLDKITFVRWESTGNTQQDACNDFLLKYGHETRWIIPYDVDEFIQINDSGKTLREYLQESESYGYVHCQWRHFNADGHVTKPEGKVVSNFTKQADWYDWPSSGKKFVQTYRCAGFSGYNPVLKSGTVYLDDEADNTGYFQLNHYFTKSLEEWTEKMHRGSCSPRVLRHYRLFFTLNPDMENLDTGKDYIQPYIGE